MTISRAHFFATYRNNFGRLSQSRVDVLAGLLNNIESSTRIKDKRHVAYILATMAHETAWTFMPIKEYRASKWKKPHKNWGLILSIIQAGP